MSWEVVKDREFYWLLVTETVSQEKIKFRTLTLNFNASSPRDRWVDAFDDCRGLTSVLVWKKEFRHSDLSLVISKLWCFPSHRFS